MFPGFAEKAKTRKLKTQRTCLRRWRQNATHASPHLHTDRRRRVFPRRQTSSHLAQLIRGNFKEALSVFYKSATALSIIDYL